MGGYSTEEFQQQIGELYPRLYRAVSAYVYGSGADPQDILQDTFLKACRNLDRFDGSSALYTWLYKIARNTCIDYFRKYKYEKKRSAFPVEEHALSDTEPQLTEEIRLLRKAIARLPDELRELVIMKSIDEMSYQEISGITGVNEQTLKSRMLKARRLLAESLKTFGVTEL